MKLLGGVKVAAAKRIRQKPKSKNRFIFNYLCTVSVDDAGCISDHRMIIATLSVGWRQHQKVNFIFRRTKSVDSESFEQALYVSSLFTAPKTSTDEFADPLADIVTAELDKVAPLHHATRSSHGRKINEFLSDTAKQA